MRRIVGVHFPKLGESVARVCIDTFYKLRELRGVEKSRPPAN